MAQVSRSGRVPAGAPMTRASDASYVDWPAIFAGAAVASAIAFVLTAFGAAIGLTLTSPYEGEGEVGAGLVIAIGLWSVWATVSSFMAGGYLTGRMRRRIPDSTSHEAEIRDGAHGLVVWALGVLVGAAMVASGAYATARVGAEAASAAMTGADDGAGPRYHYLADTLLRTDGEARNADEAAATEEVARILQRSSAEGGEISDVDRAYLVLLVAGRTGISEQDARARVDSAVSRFQTLEQQAKDAAETARKISIVAAFILAASLLVAGAGAWWAAGIGGRHRDARTVLAFFGRRI